MEEKRDDCRGIVNFKFFFNKEKNDEKSDGFCFGCVGL